MECHFKCEKMKNIFSKISQKISRGVERLKVFQVQQLNFVYSTRSLIMFALRVAVFTLNYFLVELPFNDFNFFSIYRKFQQQSPLKNQVNSLPSEEGKTSETTKGEFAQFS